MSLGQKGSLKHEKMQKQSGKTVLKVWKYTLDRHITISGGDGGGGGDDCDDDDDNDDDDKYGYRL